MGSTESNLRNHGVEAEQMVGTVRRPSIFNSGTFFALIKRRVRRYDTSAVVLSVDEWLVIIESNEFHHSNFQGNKGEFNRCKLDQVLDFKYWRQYLFCNNTLHNVFYNVKRLIQRQEPRDALVSPAAVWAFACPRGRKISHEAKKFPPTSRSAVL